MISSGVASARWHRLFAPVDIAFLVYFRIAFGALMVWSLADLASGGIALVYLRPRVLFSYFGFDWARPWPGAGMYLHVAALIVLAVCLGLGFCYRAAAALFWLGMTYLFLLDAMSYLNHEYLICLVSFLLVFLPAHRAASLDASIRLRLRRSTAPAWTLWLLRLQFGVPYVYGGLAKLNHDWLSGAPVRLGLSERASDPLFGSLFAQEWTVWLFVYGGIAIDLLAVPLLLWPRTRTLAFVATVAFHLVNAATFNIGVFPWLMIAGTALFFPPGWPRVLELNWSMAACEREPAAPGEPGVHCPGRLERPGHSAAGGGLTRRQKVTAALLTTYVVVQLLLPFRHFLYPGDASWTKEGHRFAWRMMLNYKRGLVRFYATNPRTGESWPIVVESLLTPWQFRRLALDPDFIQQSARHLAGELRSHGFDGFEIHAVALVSLNGRKPQLLVDPEVDLAAQPRTLLPKPWVMPLVEPLPERLWDVPVSRWPESHLKYPANSRN